jgi:hypothetical protein
MEILAAGGGSPSSDGATVTAADVQNALTPWLTFITNHPANPSTGARN